MSARIYVACLASYNSGRLYGTWIDFDSADMARESIQAMIDKSPTPGAEEWAIHDFEGFGTLKVSENHDLDDLEEWVRMSDLHGAAWGAYVDLVGEKYATEEGFDDSFRGVADSPEEYAERVAEDCGLLSDACEMGCKGPRNPLLKYIDWERYARDMSYEGWHFVRIPDGGGRVWVFSP